MKPEASLQVLHRDEGLLVVNKPSGLAVHRGWAQDGVVVLTAARALAGRHVFPVHRLDRGASGVLLLALDAGLARGLAAAFAAARVAKRYLALVRGIPPAEGIIDHPIPRTPGGARVPAVTSYRRLGSFERYAWLEVVPATGRLHQIRRHLKHISHPLIGDVRYGKGEHNRLFRERFGLHRLALHAAGLGLDDPRTGEPLSFLAPLPADLAGPLAAMGLLPGGGLPAIPPGSLAPPAAAPGAAVPP